MTKRYPELPDWSFEMEEVVSAGAYQVIGRSRLGLVVSAEGTDLDLLIEKCKSEASSASMGP